MTVAFGPKTWTKEDGAVIRTRRTRRPPFQVNLQLWFNRYCNIGGCSGRVQWGMDVTSVDCEWLWWVAGERALILRALVAPRRTLLCISRGRLRTFRWIGFRAAMRHETVQYEVTWAEEFTILRSQGLETSRKPSHNGMDGLTDCQTVQYVVRSCAAPGLRYKPIDQEGSHRVTSTCNSRTCHRAVSKSQSTHVELSVMGTS
jgi:hypothetical protein